MLTNRDGAAGFCHGQAAQSASRAFRRRSSLDGAGRSRLYRGRVSEFAPMGASERVKAGARPEVAARIAELRNEFAASCQLSVEYLQAKLLPAAEANVVDFFTSNRKLKSIELDYARSGGGDLKHQIPRRWHGCGAQARSQRGRSKHPVEIRGGNRRAASACAPSCSDLAR